MSLHAIPVTFLKPGAKAGSALVTFEIEDENREAAQELMNFPMGKQLLLCIYEIEADAEQIRKAHEDPNYTRSQLLKQMYARIGDIALEAGVKDETVKYLLKARLKTKKVIKESLSELTEGTVAQAIFELQTYLKPPTYDYEPYRNDPKHAATA